MRAEVAELFHVPLHVPSSVEAEDVAAAAEAAVVTTAVCEAGALAGRVVDVALARAASNGVDSGQLCKLLIA